MSLRNRWWLPLTTSTVTLSPVLIVLGVVVTLSNANFADPYWLDLSSKATASVLFLAPGFAALGAWDAARWRALTEAAVRSWLELLVRQLAVVAAATSLTFGVALLFLYVQVPPDVGLPRFDVLALGVMVTMGYAALGFAVGRFLPRLVGAPLLFAAVWLWIAYTPAVQPFWLRNVTGNLGTSCCALDSQLVRYAIAAPALLAGALLMASAAVLLWPRQRAVWGGSVALVVVALLVARHWVIDFGADPVEYRTGAQECVNADGSQFCAWPEHASRLEEAAPVLGATAKRLRTAGLDVPRELRETVRADGGWSFDLASDSSAFWGQVLSTSPLNGLPPSCTDHNGGTWPAGVHEGLATAWILNVGGVPETEAAETAGTPSAQLRRLRALPAQEQLAWFTKVFAAMQTCEPVK